MYNPTKQRHQLSTSLDHQEPTEVPSFGINADSCELTTIIPQDGVLAFWIWRENVCRKELEVGIAFCFGE